LRLSWESLAIANSTALAAFDVVFLFRRAIRAAPFKCLSHHYHALLNNNLWKSAGSPNRDLAFVDFFIESNAWPAPIPVEEDDAGLLKDAANKDDCVF
jgi:hypothetical protein